MNAIIVKRLGARGDVILTTAVIRALRRQRPEKRIFVVTHYPEVFQHNPDIDEIFTDEWNEARDRSSTIDLDRAHESMPGHHIVMSYAGRCGLSIPESEWKPILYFDRIAMYKAEHVIPPGTPYAVVHPGVISGWAGRQWPWDRFVDLCGRLKASGIAVAQAGAETDDQLPVRYDLRGIEFQVFCATMHRATLFVGVDSMPFHVAQAFSVPSTVIFGAIRPETRVIPGLPVRSVAAEDLRCLGCFHRQTGDTKIISSCPEGHERCMKDLSVDRVMEAIRL